jgi:hypothetical protein
MSKLQKSLAALLLVPCISVFAQQRERAPQAARGGGEVGHGYVPQHGPAPRVPAQHAPAPARTYNSQDHPGHPNAPHVEPNGTWVGHEDGAKYHIDHPWAHGHVGGGIGPSHRYRLAGGAPSRFFLGGFYFSVAAADVAFCNGWLWDSDDIVIYDDPDDPGYYLAYNTRTGVYVHVLYLGA